MKKLISLILCLVLICLALVGCGKEVIGDYLSHYENTDLTDEQVETLNFYIITGDETVRDAKITVEQNINTFLKEKYHIELNIEYFTEDEYRDGVLSAMNTDKESNRPDIVLINSPELFDELYQDNSLLALNNAGDLDFFGTDYKKLNTIIDKALLSASAVDGTYYTVPNNHKIGYYEYIVINKEMARDTLHFPEEELKAMTTEASIEELKARILALDSTLDVNDYISIRRGDYMDLENYKKLDLATGNMPTETASNPAPEVNFVNVKAYPNATVEEAFLSAFGIIKNLDDTEDYAGYTDEKKALLKSHYNKCMRIIYALNTDVEFKNMLQYGYIGTNYTVDKNRDNYINLIRNNSVRYDMNNIHTGNSYISYYCNEISWDADTHNVWLRQNANAKTPNQKMTHEAANIVLPVTEVKPGSVIDTKLIPSVGVDYTDVTISWKVDSENTNVSMNNGVITFGKPEKDEEVVITAVFTCNGETYEKAFTVKLKAK